MKTILLLALLLIFSVSLATATPPGKTQQLTSPDQVPEGLAKSDWQGIRAAYEAGRHAFQSIEGGWQARNPGQQWITKFDGRGFVAEPLDGGWQWGLELKSYGFPGAERVIRDVPAVLAEGQRLTYGWDAAVQEWFVNDARGLEHGFTVKARPAGAPALNSPPLGAPKPGEGGSTLNFLLAVRGTLTPVITADSLGVEFRDAAGAAVLTYSGLKVWDADGKSLKSHFEVSDAQLSTFNSQPSLRLFVEERDARYPLTIDPVAQQAYLKPAAVGTTQTFDFFGRAVAVSGDTVVVGAPREDSSTTGVNSTPDELAADSGAAYVFVRNGATWTQQAYLKPAAVGTSQVGDSFGSSVAISGDTVVVGAPNEDSSTTGVNSTPDENAYGAGAAYVFVRSGTTWTQQAYLKPDDVGTTQDGDEFGRSVAVSGDTVVVGAPFEASSTTGVNSTPDEDVESGAAYVFVRSGTTWTQQAYLKPDDVGTTQDGDEFGRSVAVSGDTVVVGAWAEDSNTTGVNSTPNESAADSGAAYIFVRNGTTWTQQAYLKPAAVGTSQLSDQFGWSVAVSGDTVVVGAYGEDSSTRGVNSTPDESAVKSGAAYVFFRNGTTWTQQVYLKPAYVGTSQVLDGFGYSVAVSGDTVVVGALFEDSSTTGVNSAPDESAAAAGAAYVFARSGTLWTQQAYLKPAAVGTTQEDDQFGFSVAVAGDTVVVGANGEDSSTTGVNSTPDESANAAGAAYVFVVPAPVPVVFVNPTGGSPAGGTSVTIHGSSFTGATGVMFGGAAAASFTVNGDTKITATTPAHAAGLVDVVVTMPLSTGTGAGLFTYATVTNTADTDGDGLNDAAEFQLATLGFDWQAAQPALVSSFLSSSALYTLPQVQALNVGVPLLTKNPTNGMFKLTLGVEKATQLTNFLAFPMNGAGFTTSINATGKLEFNFTVPDNAAFFRLEAR